MRRRATIKNNNTAHNIQDLDVSAFLRSGALLSLSAECIWVFQGTPKSLSQPVSGQPMIYSPDFYLDSQAPYLSFPVVIKTTMSQLSKVLEAKMISIDWHMKSPKFQDFDNKIEKIRKMFKSNKLKKAVPVVFETFERAPQLNEIQALILSLLQRKQNDLYVYGLWTGQQGVLGLSPEVLWQGNVNEGLISTMALAGTRKSQDKSKNLLTDPKELNEHNIVVDEIVQKMTGVGSVNVGSTYEWDIGGLVHLRTDIQVKLSQPTTFKAITQKLHPTPALGLSGALTDWKWLKQLDGSVDRLKYGAPFGLIQEDGSGCVVVGIRNLQWNAGKSMLGSGCGVVPQSDTKKEWLELSAKRDYVKSQLGL